MDTTTAPQPVAAPAAAPSAAPAAPVAPVNTPINSVTQKPISEAAHKLFNMLQSSGDPLKDEPEAKPEPKAPEAKPEAAPAAPAADEKPIKVSKKPVKRPELPIPKDEPAPAATPAPTAPAPAAAPDDKWEESLLDDEKAALEDARFAEKVDPKFKGLSDRMGKFFREQKAYLEKHPDADEDDAGYKKILATQPVLSAADKRTIAEARIEERVSSRYKPELEKIEHQLFVRDEEPKIEQEAAQIRHHMAFNALPKEMLDVLNDKTKGIEVLKKDYADELEVAGGLINTLTEDAKELLRITRFDPKTKRPLGDVASDPSHPKYAQHERIANMVNEVCSDFQKNAPQTEQVRDGKWFVTREEWAKLPANARHQFWTFTNSDTHVREMIQRAMSWMPDAIARSIKTRQDSLKARGYERRRPEPAPAPAAAPPQPTGTPPSPRPAPAPAQTATPAGQKTPGQLLAARLAAEG